MNTLESALLAAHASGDTAALVTLYAQASEQAETVDMAGFYLTHAYVFALELNHPQASELRQRLIDAGREEPLPPPRAPSR
ncbi:MAG: hypothetical protein HKP51_06885 [Sulfitobacter sp.]|nr:hypothetical protein [Sulfitobacter sp.]